MTFCLLVTDYTLGPAPRPAEDLPFGSRGTPSKLFLILGWLKIAGRYQTVLFYFSLWRLSFSLWPFPIFVARHDLDGLKMMDSSTLNNPFWWCLRGTFIANPCKHTFCRNGRAPAIGCWARTASTFQPPSASLLGQKHVHFHGVQGMKISELWPKPLLFCFVHWDILANYGGDKHPLL